MNPADLTLSISPTLTQRPIPAPLSLALKNGRTPVPRVDLEPIYTQLKAALGDGWVDYKAAVNAFVLGLLNQAELSWCLQPLLNTTPTPINNKDSPAVPTSTLYLHNTLLAALYANTLRDPPPTEVAPWVVATDKPTAASKNAGASGANDKAEERLKKEVMAIHARDRRRIKTLKEGGRAVNDGFSEMQDYRLELAIKPPDVVPPSAGGIAKTNWDIEIRRRYNLPLAQETLEFPAPDNMQGRIEPICYEEGLTGGAGQSALQACAELMEQATEVFLKELLGEMYAHTRANGEGCIHTSKFKRQFRKEEDDFERGIVSRNPAGLLPVEMEVQAKRSPLNVDDLRLAVQLNDTYFKQDQFLSQNTLLSRYPELHTPTPKANGIFARPAPVTNGVVTNGIATNGSVADIDDDSWNWRGASKHDVDDLMSVLDDCLAVG